MRKLVIFLLIMLFLQLEQALAQSAFEQFVSSFPQRSYDDPIFDISQNGSTSFMTDTVSVDLYNQVLSNTSDDPCYVLLDGTSKEVEFIGEINTKPLKIFEGFDSNGKEVYRSFKTKLYPLARIDLISNYTTLLMTVRGYDPVYVLLLNFDNNGKVLSAIQVSSLESTSSEVIFTNPLYDFRIESDGKVYQEYDGLDFYRERKYELQADGHFKIVWENIVDK